MTFLKTKQGLKQEWQKSPSIQNINAYLYLRFFLLIILRDDGWKWRYQIFTGMWGKTSFRLARTALIERITEIRLRIVDKEIPDDVLLKKTKNVSFSAKLAKKYIVLWSNTVLYSTYMQTVNISVTFSTSLPISLTMFKNSANAWINIIVNTNIWIDILIFTTIFSCRMKAWIFHNCSLCFAFSRNIKDGDWGQGRREISHLGDAPALGQIGINDTGGRKRKGRDSKIERYRKQKKEKAVTTGEFSIRYTFDQSYLTE